MSLRPHARRGDWGRGEVLLTLYGIVWELNYYVIQGLDLTTCDQRKWAAGFDFFRKCHGTFNHIRTGLQHEFLFRAARSTSQATHTTQSGHAVSAMLSDRTSQSSSRVRRRLAYTVGYRHMDIGMRGVRPAPISDKVPHVLVFTLTLRM